MSPDAPPKVLHDTPVHDPVPAVLSVTLLPFSAVASAVPVTLPADAIMISTGSSSHWPV